MSKACVFFADGLEECEALIVVDVLRRAGVEVTTASISGSRTVRSTHGVGLEADALAAELNEADFDLLVLPGGQPGTIHLGESPVVARMVTAAAAQGKKIAAICAAPTVLAKLGLLNGRTEGGNAHYYVSDTPDNFDELEHRFLGEYAGGPVEQIAIETY